MFKQFCALVTAVVASAMLLTVDGGSAAAQLPGVTSAPAAVAPAVPDPLGRQTPLGTITGFSAAVNDSDFLTAGRYLQRGGRTGQDVENIARDLNELLDRYFTQGINTLSTSPAGRVDDGLPLNRERVPLKIGARSVDLFLTRVPDPQTGQIWLVSSDTLAQVPSLIESPQVTLVERVMPATWVSRTLFDVSLAQWVLYAASIVIPLLLFWTLATAANALIRRRNPDLTRRALVSSWWKGVSWLLVLGFSLVAHLEFMPLLGFSLTFRYTYSRYALTAGVLVFALLVWRLMTVSFYHARLLALRRGRSDTRSLMLLGERVLKVLVVLSALLILLSLAGVDTSTALAGVGIFGVAVALGAQKSIENLLGGIFLLTDKALAVGDFCQISDRIGWIEDITLRSIRLRTKEQTLLSIPAGALAQGNIENFATRQKIPVETVLPLKYGATPDQLRSVLKGIRGLLDGHALVEKETSRIRLVNFGPKAIELELFAYLETSDAIRFMAEREDLLLAAATILESCGTGFASPDQFVSLSLDAPRQQPEPDPS
ncbi:MAG TPA: mechanosensitive ion channel domain-containing protein [Vicinamibacterales bacterium]